MTQSNSLSKQNQQGSIAVSWLNQGADNTVLEPQPDVADDQRYLIAENWTHLDNEAREYFLRWITDVRSGQLIDVQYRYSQEQTWQPAGRERWNDVLDHLRNNAANIPFTDAWWGDEVRQSPQLPAWINAKHPDKAHSEMGGRPSLKNLIDHLGTGLMQLLQMTWTAWQVLRNSGRLVILSMISTGLAQFARAMNETLDDEHWIPDAELDHRIERRPTGIFSYLCAGVPTSVEEMRRIWSSIIAMDAGIYWDNLPTDLLEELHRWGNTFSDDGQWYRGPGPGAAPTAEPEVEGYRVSRLILWHRVSPSVAMHILAGLRTNPGRWKKMLIADLESRAFLGWPPYEVFSQEGQTLGARPMWMEGDGHAEEERPA